jgi:peptidoglycan/LPS O-acetylase OafA/YrhL
MQKWTELFKIDIDGNRIYGLDILRAISILFVVLGHGNRFLPPNPLLNYLVFDGVSIFFVLSGFLIGGILIKILERGNASSKSLLNFYIRRWLRTLPNYFFILTTLVLLSFSFDNLRLKVIYKYFLFAQNIFTPHPAFFSEAWSLPIEEWFYLLIPVILFFCVGKLRIPVKKAVLVVSIITIVLTILFRYYRYLGNPVTSVPQWDMLYRKQVATRLDSLMFGVLGAYALYYYKPRWVKYKNLLFFIGLAVLLSTRGVRVLFDSYLYLCVFSFTITAIAILFLLPFLSEYKSGSGFIYKVMTYVSIISYSMYLINLTLVQNWMLKPLQFLNLSDMQYMLLSYPLFWLFTIAISILLYKYLEKPFMDLREKVRI